MYKRLEFFPQDRNGVEMELIHPGVLTKTAEMSTELADYIRAMKTELDKMYILVNALSAGEYYGPNRNGDYMAESVLQKYHKHFEDQGHVYKHHKNKDPKIALGKVLFSHYNPNMHRVELVCELNANKDEAFINRIERGEYPAVSMGMRTPYDECSICHNKAKSLPQYCKHLKYEMGRTYSDGRRVMAINPAAKFFDISFVMIGADPTAGVMKKLAGLDIVRSSAQLGEEFLRLASIKEADIDKEIPVENVEVQTIVKDNNNNIYLSQPTIPKETIRSMVKDASLGEIFSSLAGMAITPKPLDFQRIVLYSQGQEKYAEALERNHILLVQPDETTKPLEIENLHINNINERFIRKYAHLAEERAMTKQVVTARILEKFAAKEDAKEDQEFFLKKESPAWKKFLFGETEDAKLSPYKNPILASSILSGMYYGLHKYVPWQTGNSIPGGVDAFMMKRPWIIPLLIGATSAGSIAGQNYLDKSAKLIAPNPIARYLFAVPASYLYSGVQEAKVRKGQRIGEFENIARKHPMLTSLLVGMGLGKVTKLLTKKGSLDRSNLRRAISSLSDDKLDELFNDVINL